VKLKPSYIQLLEQYSTMNCPTSGRKPHNICRNYSKSGRLLRNPQVVQRFLDSLGNPAMGVGSQVDHIVPLCLGGPDCECNMQLLTSQQHKTKTVIDLKACSLYSVKL